jgi:hypothetical protein
VPFYFDHGASIAFDIYPAGLKKIVCALPLPFCTDQEFVAPELGVWLRDCIWESNLLKKGQSRRKS